MESEGSWRTFLVVACIVQTEGLVSDGATFPTSSGNLRPGRAALRENGVPSEQIATLSFRLHHIFTRMQRVGIEKSPWLQHEGTREQKHPRRASGLAGSEWRESGTKVDVIQPLRAFCPLLPNLRKFHVVDW